MCINIETSITSFCIGEIAGFILALNKDKYKSSVGIFIMFFSLVQLFEALIYKGYDKNGIISKILFINLSLQGVLFFYLFQRFDTKYKVFLYMSIFISIVAILRIFIYKFNKVSLENCLTWNFMFNKINYWLLHIMYTLIFIYLFMSNNNYLIKFGLLILTTYIFSRFWFNIKFTASMWCLTSAIVSPIAIFI